MRRGVVIHEVRREKTQNDIFHTIRGVDIRNNDVNGRDRIMVQEDVKRNDTGNRMGDLLKKLRTY